MYVFEPTLDGLAVQGGAERYRPTYALEKWGWLGDTESVERWFRRFGRKLYGQTSLECGSVSGCGGYRLLGRAAGRECSIDPASAGVAES